MSQRTKAIKQICADDCGFTITDRSHKKERARTLHYLNKYEELKSYLKSHSLNIEEVLYKLKLEFLWNEFIYKNYAKKVNIDKKKLKLKIKKDLNNKMTIDEYYLREILFKLEDNEKFEDKYKKILELIEKDGFENAAIIFSISNKRLVKSLYI